MKKSDEIIKDIQNRNHNYLIMINDFGVSLAKNSLSFFEVQSFFKNLANYAAHQFEDLKQIFDEFEIDERQVQSHIKNQKIFLNEVNYMCSYVSDDVYKIKPLLNFLIFWSESEVNNQNFLLFKQVELIKKGMTPSDAYELMSLHDNTTFARTINNFINTLIQKNDELVQSNAALQVKLNKTTKKLDALTKELDAFPVVDSITNLPNRTQALKALNILFNEENKNAGVLLFSLTSYNDMINQLGYEVTNNIFLAIIRIIKNSIRSDDLIYSMKKDELMIICQNLNEASAINISNILIERITKNTVLNTLLGSFDKLSVNIGIALFQSVSDIDDLLILADRKLKNAQTMGKNRIEI